MLSTSSLRAHGARLAAVALISVVAVAAAGGFGGGADAAAVERLVSTRVTSAVAVDRVCHERVVTSGEGVDTRQVVMPEAGLVRADLDGGGDWDLAVFDTESDEVVAGSASSGTNEVAEGFVSAGQRLVVQSCRVSGDSSTAQLSVSSIALPPAENLGEKIQVVNADTPTAADKERLLGMGFDLSEGGDRHHVGLVLYGADDVARLTEAGFTYDVLVEDLVAANTANREADAAYAQSVESSGLPSGRTSYRHLRDFQVEMKDLAEAKPDLVRSFALRHPTWQGRTVEGIEITQNPNNLKDGKPVFLIMGAHHAREWPSAEHTMEFAYDLVNNYGTDPRITDLVRNVRTIVIPVVNPDGFNLSREAPIDLRTLGDVTDLGHTVAIVADPGFAYKRRNCNMSPSPVPHEVGGSDCANRLNRNQGVDPNRNYGGFWGGPGASSDPTNDTFRGSGPFSEPETQNIRELVSQRQVVMLISNHTFSNLILRPPGVRAYDPDPDSPDNPVTPFITPDEDAMKGLGDQMASQNGYLSQPGYGLYDTTGTTEDWSYWTTGGYGYTFEIGGEEFHPPYEEVVSEYVGAGPFAGKGNRKAFLLALETAADRSHHAVLEGTAPRGSVLRLEKTFETPTWAALDGEASGNDTFTDTLSTNLKVGRTKQFRWHINPSTRPVVSERVNKGLAESPAKKENFGPAVLVPGGGDQSEGVTSKDFPFTIAENDPRAGVKIRIEWATPGSDWDLYVYRKEGDALIPVGLSASDNSERSSEEVLLEDPVAGNYVARVVNWLAVDELWTGTIEYFEAGSSTVLPGLIPGTAESWKLTCERSGSVQGSRAITIDRGEIKKINATKICS